MQTGEIHEGAVRVDELPVISTSGSFTARESTLYVYGKADISRSWVRNEQSPHGRAITLTMEKGELNSASATAVPSDRTHVDRSLRQ